MHNILKRFTIGQVLMLVVMVALVALMIFTANPAWLLIAPAAMTIEEVAAEASRQIKDVESKQTSLHGDLVTMKAEVDDRIKKFGETLPDTLKAAIDRALTTYNGLPEQLTTLKGVVTDLEQKLASGTVQNPDEAKSFGQQFIESQGYKSIKDSGREISQHRGLIRAEMKTVTVANAGGLNNRTVRDPEIIKLAQRRLVVRDLMRSVRVDSIAVEYAKQTTRTNNAAPVAEAAAKPYSDYVWSTATVNIRTLAHLAKITRQAMDDAPRLMDEIDQELRYGLGYVEEQQFLYGNNTGQNLNGIIPQATASSYPQVIAFPNRMDVLRLAVLQVVTGSLLPADGIVIHDDDWAVIELAKDANGQYLFGHPQGSTAPRAWNLPLVVTPAILTGDYLVGNFALGATVYDRMGVEVLISTENVDDFEKNLATVRCEERVAVGVKRPLAFVTGDFATDITAITT